VSYVYLDDHAPAHPKIIRAGAEAAWLWACSLAFCNAHHTDGFVPADMVCTLYPPLAAKVSRLSAKLVSVGLWHRESGGFRVHDYAEYQYGASKARKKAKTAARVARFRQRESERLGNARSNADVTPDETPVTIVYPPHPTTTTTPTAALDLAAQIAQHHADRSGTLAASSKELHAAKEIARVFGAEWQAAYTRWTADPWVAEKRPPLQHMADNAGKYGRDATPTAQPVDANPYRGLEVLRDCRPTD
jgi:hypothetical protein